MKNIIIAVFFLLAAATVNAQTTNKTAGKTGTDKAVDAKPSTDGGLDKDAKSIEIKPGTQKGMPIKNADRPKASTIQPESEKSKVFVSSNPVPVIKEN